MISWVDNAEAKLNSGLVAHPGEKLNQKRRVLIGSILVDNLNWGEAIGKVEDLIREGGRAYALTPNVDHIIQAESDRLFLKIYREADLVLADGVPILWAARFLGVPLQEKISGSDFLVRFCPVAVEKGYRLFYLGGKDDAAEITADRLSRRYPGLKIAGVYSPPLGFELDRENNGRVIAEINRIAPDIVFVGLGTPKQEKWIYANRTFYRAPMSFPVGAGFDFISGKSRRAPRWMQKNGLEWFWRLMREPCRLGQRYLVRDMRFFPLIWRQRYRRK